MGRVDVLVVGGGVMGSSVAYFLLRERPGLRVAVVEPDPTYEFASTPRASGGARRLFSCPENIAMSMFGIDCIRSLPEAGWKPGGYLFIGRRPASPPWRKAGGLRPRSARGSNCSIVPASHGSSRR